MEKIPAPGQIVILNGAPRSGKSSIIAEIQARFDGLWMNLGVDRFMQATPARYQPGIGLRPGGERPDLESVIPLLYRALYESLAAHSRLGIHVAADVGHHDSYAAPHNILPECARCLSGLPAWFVGVRCPLDVIMQRRRDTGWNAESPADEPAPRPVRLWQSEVHIPGIYDLEVDTSLLTPPECAAKIWQSMTLGPAPSALPRLAEMTREQTGTNEGIVIAPDLC